MVVEVRGGPTRWVQWGNSSVRMDSHTLGQTPQVATSKRGSMGTMAEVEVKRRRGVSRERLLLMAMVWKLVDQLVWFCFLCDENGE